MNWGVLLFVIADVGSLVCAGIAGVHLYEAFKLIGKDSPDFEARSIAGMQWAVAAVLFAAMMIPIRELFDLRFAWEF